MDGCRAARHLCSRENQGLTTLLVTRARKRTTQEIILHPRPEESAATSDSAPPKNSRAWSMAESSDVKKNGETRQETGSLTNDFTTMMNKGKLRSSLR